MTAAVAFGQKAPSAPSGTARCSPAITAPLEPYQTTTASCGVYQATARGLAGAVTPRGAVACDAAGARERTGADLGQVGDESLALAGGLA